MNIAELDRIRQWFHDYVTGFAAPDGSLHNTFVVKRDHSRRVSADCRILAEALDWEAGRVAAAEALGLLHDIGRFRQFQRFRTLIDAASVDHGKLGREVVADSDLLSVSDAEETAAILCGVCCHNKRELPDGIGGESLAFLKLIRDADKLDIIRAVSDIVKNGSFSRHPELLLNVDLDGPANPALLEDIACRRPGSYAHVKSLVDMNLMRLSWVYDLNYLPTYRLFSSRGLLAEIKEMIPDTPEVRRIAEMAESYVMEKIGLPCPAAPGTELNSPRETAQP